MDYAKQLADLCSLDADGMPRYIVRTRVERAMYGMLATVCLARLGARPAGLHESQLQTMVPRESAQTGDPAHQLMWEIVDSFTEFTYLCDSSNRSSDGQDVRLERSRGRFLKICNDFASLTA